MAHRSDAAANSETISGAHRRRSDPHRILDLVIAIPATLALAPVLLVIATLIRLDSPGPVLFRQWREGRNMTRFRCFKFRTMNWHASDLSGTHQARNGDRRITRFGRILRETGLDELPQLLNVIRGEMAIVGPRPHAPDSVVDGARFETVTAGYRQRYAVRPGITGLAQIHGHRGPIESRADLDDRVTHDLAYIARRSVMFDLWIIAMTPIALVKTKGT